MSGLVGGRYLTHFIALVVLGLWDRGDQLIINCLLRVAFQILARESSVPRADSAYALGHGRAGGLLPEARGWGPAGALAGPLDGPGAPSPDRVPSPPGPSPRPVFWGFSPYRRFLPKASAWPARKSPKRLLALQSRAPRPGWEPGGDTCDQMLIFYIHWIFLPNFQKRPFLAESKGNCEALKKTRSPDHDPSLGSARCPASLPCLGPPGPASEPSWAPRSPGDTFRWQIWSLTRGLELSVAPREKALTEKLQPLVGSSEAPPSSLVSFPRSVARGLRGHPPGVAWPSLPSTCAPAAPTCRRSRSGLQVPRPTGRWIQRQPELGPKGARARPAGSSRTWAWVWASGCVTLSKLPGLSEPGFLGPETGDAVACACHGPGKRSVTRFSMRWPDLGRWSPEPRLGVKKPNLVPGGALWEDAVSFLCSPHSGWELRGVGACVGHGVPFSSAPLLLGDLGPEPGLSGPLFSPLK